MQNSNWETSLITKTINKVLSNKTEHSARRKSLKRQNKLDNVKTVKTH